MAHVLHVYVGLAHAGKRREPISSHRCSDHQVSTSLS